VAEQDDSPAPAPATALAPALAPAQPKGEAQAAQIPPTEEEAAPAAQTEQSAAHAGPVEQAGAPSALTEEEAAQAAEERRIAKLVDIAARASTRPGVYLFRDKHGKVLYVGKAKNLRNRVRSYVRGGDGRYHVRFLMDRANNLETIVTASETEALILENNLIKQYKPRYNVNLKDDKSYVSVKVTTKDAWPRIVVTRKIAQDGNTYLGPFASASGIRETVAVSRKLFPLRTCSDSVFRNRSRPCLEYQIHRCLGPCVLEVDRGEYQRHLDDAIKLLEGKPDVLVAAMSDQMAKAAENERFEDAARLRDRISVVTKVSEKQKVVVHGGGDRDVFGLYREGGFVEAQVLMVRGGKLVDSIGYHFADYEFPDEELLGSMVSRFYDASRFVPEEILLPCAIEGDDALADYLNEKRQRRVKLLVPLRGEKYRLLEMARDNAEHSFRERNDEGVRREKMLDELGRRLGLASTPKRIECFDISHTQGEAVVASMVAFDEGIPDKSGYRRYKLKTVQRNDDFAAMKEILSRRLKRGRDEGGLPDLILIDGGKGQLAMAVEAMRELEIEGVELASLAKDHVRADPRSSEIEHTEERVFRPGRSNPVGLRPNSSALFLLQQLRDEAHRFAITYHRELRSKKRLRSALDDLPGIGPEKRKALLRTFGSVKRVSEASAEDIAALPGFSLESARVLLSALGSTSPVVG
jgi:excinuclease ABC subunit C